MTVPVHASRVGHLPVELVDEEKKGGWRVKSGSYTLLTPGKNYENAQKISRGARTREAERTKV